MDIVIHQVDIVDRNDQELFVMSVEYLQGEEPHRVAMIRPTDVFETRVAEYDLDPDDIETILEVIFYEMFLTIEEEDKSKTLHIAPTKEIARKEYMRRIRKMCDNGKLIGMTGNSPYVPTTPGDVVVASSGTEDPVEFLKRELVMSPEHISVKRAYVNAIVAETRKQHKQREQIRAARRLGGRRRRESPQELRQQLISGGPGGGQHPV
jgi:hypothetical protein